METIDLNPMDTYSSSEKLDLILNNPNLQPYQISRLANSLSNSDKLALLLNYDSIKKSGLEEFEILSLSSDLEDEQKRQLLSNLDYLRNTLNLSDSSLSTIISTFSNDNDKLNLLANASLDGYYKFKVLSSLLDNCKLSVIQDESYNLAKHDITDLLSLLDVDNFINFYNENPDFFESKSISLNTVIMRMSQTNQLSFVNNIDKLNLDIRYQKSAYCYFTKCCKKMY